MAKCKLGDILTQIHEEELMSLSEAIAIKDSDDNYVWSARNLARAVNKTRFSVGATTIKEHRNETCGCY